MDLHTHYTAVAGILGSGAIQHPPLGREKGQATFDTLAVTYQQSTE